MPGPVSDSYDPEFGTTANAQEVKDALAAVRQRITNDVFEGDETLKDILQIVREGPKLDGEPKDRKAIYLTENEWRVIRFGLRYAEEAI